MTANNGTSAAAILCGRCGSVELHESVRATAGRAAGAKPASAGFEDEIGVDLLKRSPRGVTLTAEGQLFLKEARDK